MDVVQQIRVMSSDGHAADAVAAFAAAEVDAVKVQHARDMYGAEWKMGDVLRTLNARVVVAERERDEAREALLDIADDLEGLRDASEFLWAVLATVSCGDWTQQTREWQDAAAR